MSKKMRMSAWALGLAGLLAAAPAMAEIGVAAQVVTGQVVSMDQSKHELTIRQDGNGQTRTFKVLNPDSLASLKAGDNVQVNAADEKSGQIINR